MAGETNHNMSECTMPLQGERRTEDMKDGGGFKGTAEKHRLHRGGCMRARHAAFVEAYITAE